MVIGKHIPNSNRIVEKRLEGLEKRIKGKEYD
jgi:hypothetical protein